MQPHYVTETPHMTLPLVKAPPVPPWHIGPVLPGQVPRTPGRKRTHQVRILGALPELQELAERKFHPKSTFNDRNFAFVG
jgi:hypothetical protein